MNLRRVVVLLVKETKLGTRNFIFIMAIVVPFVLTFVLSLIFGTWFSGKAKLGVVDRGDSRFAEMAEGIESLNVEVYTDDDALRSAVSNGAVDMGMVLPREFDSRVVAQKPVEISAYIWGESQLKHRALLGTTILTLIRDIAGQEAPIEIVSTTLGEGDVLPWEERLLPFIVMMSMLIGGMMVPAMSLVEERQNRTLSALVITPTTVGDVLMAKGLMGVLISTIMGVVILVLNNAFGGQPTLLMLTLAMGAAMAATVGVLLGVLVKDINTLFAIIKGMGIVLYAPAIVYMFPTIPQWIGQFFPTYYIIQPVIEIAQQGAGWSDVALDLVILAALTGGLIGVVALFTRRMVGREA